MNRSRLARLLPVALLVSLLGVVAFPTTAQTMPEVIRLSLQPWLGYGPWWIAEANGYFADHGLNVEVIDFTWDQDMTAALASGNTDVMSAAANTFIALLNQGQDFQAFLILDASYEADAIVAPTSVTSIADLAGRTVAYEPGSTSDLLLNYALNEAGLSLDDIEAVPMAAADVGAALVAGRVDVGVTYEPYISAAIANREGFAKLYTGAERPGLISDVMVTTSEFIETYPDAVAALSLAWNDAVDFLRENPEEGGQIIADAVGSPLDEFQVAFEGVQVYDLEENAVLFGGDFQATFTTIGEIMMQLNPEQITMLPDPAEVFYTAHLPEVNMMATPEATPES